MHRRSFASVADDQLELERDLARRPRTAGRARAASLRLRGFRVLARNLHPGAGEVTVAQPLGQHVVVE
jgi:hypothetical protein